MPLKRFLRELKAGWSGAAVAVREIAQRTDRSVQFAKHRLDQWELNRELRLAYRSFGQRIAELALVRRPEDGGLAEAVAAGSPAAADDPELHRLVTAISRLQSRIDSLSKQLASLHLEEPEQATLLLRQRLHAAGFAEVAATIAPRSLYCGKRLSDVRQQGEWIVTAIVRHGAPFVPEGTTTLMVGDELLLVGPANVCEQAKMMLEQLELPTTEPPVA